LTLLVLINYGTLLLLRQALKPGVLALKATAVSPLTLSANSVKETDVDADFLTLSQAFARKQKRQFGGGWATGTGVLAA
jgi:hypothetical protein